MKYYFWLFLPHKVAGYAFAKLIKSVFCSNKRQAAVEYYAISISDTLTTSFWLTRYRETDMPMHDGIIRHSTRGFLDIVEKLTETSGRDEIPSSPTLTEHTRNN